MATRIQHLVTELGNRAQEITPRDDSSSLDKSEDQEESSEKHSGSSTPGLVKSKSVTDASDDRRSKRLSVGSSGDFSGQSPISSALAGSKAKKFFGDVGAATVSSSPPGKSAKEKKEKRRKSSSHHRDEKKINEEKEK